ncbi:hypothetical protein [Streptomyces sp. NPDC048392]|uniref:hypothetical protein n=1 Tax=Streptomyces sp. NPDC048392 TaxID=3365543 RepID=UPI00371D9A0E
MPANLVAPGAAEDLPATRTALPTALRLTHGPRLAAWCTGPHYVAAYPVGNDARHTVEVGSARLRTVSPLQEKEGLSRRIDASVLPAPRATYTRTP